MKIKRHTSLVHVAFRALVERCLAGRPRAWDKLLGLLSLPLRAGSKRWLTCHGCRDWHQAGKRPPNRVLD
jgi:hypothetical protein